MAFKKLKLEEFPKFGQKLMGLARENDIETPAEIAQSLYTRCYELVKPGERKNKYGKIVKSEENDIKSIIKIVQVHLNEENAYNVQSKYMYAYSQLFECSIDYLYGITEVRSQHLDIRQICEKTGLSEKAVTNLIENHDNYPENFSVTEWWSQLLEDRAFYDIPIVWRTYSERVLERQDLQKRIDAINKALGEVELDSIIRILQEMRPDTLERFKREKEDTCYGSFGKMMQYIQNYLESRTASWVEKQHKDYDEMYYRSEINKLKIIEASLKV
ncbi:hypothetical protein [Clostridium beijerinckii]|uniref:Uncharacterized protein n=1 Tax=Clostridium beijerinckii TaxID=1520 RepID=A0AAW3WAU2_CLOBE|nr:hypothetical protein [Clostridium beijerinckii]MBC2457036.1 hypothetical protein [Clostridium beijerinckii]MBC2475608.1 hypothetical protein [Clostridium beijerinckii]NOV63089.1 hypothetical protein [Clostridium beijerinckii]NOV69949.1 hypothetical protein [Clostridium beijerinckii]NOW31144.1 hypothetical protein [Clostridium beijerinckii]